MTLSTAEELAEALDQVHSAETEDERKKALARYVAAERAHFAKLGIDVQGGGLLTRLLPVVLILFLVVIAVIGIDNASKTENLASDASALAITIQGVTCGQANSTALAYRVRGVTPSGTVEPTEHFANRLRAQRFTLSQTIGLGCGDLHGLGHFSQRRAAALAEIASLLHQLREARPRHHSGTGAGVGGSSPADASTPSVAVPVPTSPTQPTAPPDGQNQPPPVTGPQGPQGPPGDDGQDGDAGTTPPPQQPEQPGLLDPVTQPVCDLTGICL